MKVALSIAGSDSSGGAGIQADIKVFADLGVYGTTAVTAVTAQNSTGVMKINKTPPRIVAAQIDAVTRDIGADACKIGMLYSEQVVSVVAERIKRRKIANVVLDPVIFAKDGTRLLLAKAVARMKKELIPVCDLVMPNAVEASELAGLTVTDVKTARDAAKVIFERLGARNVLVKGGHFEGSPVDLFYDGREFIELSSERVEGKTMHGTGCIMSAAATARIAIGDSVVEAVRFAKDYVLSAIKNSVKLGKGGMQFYNG